MSASVDVVIIGNGLASLIAARILLEDGLRPLLLNPDDDFFREDSELPFQPLSGQESQTDVPLIHAQQAEKMLEVLRPHYPGSVEFWSEASSKKTEVRNSFAPFVRSRHWLWLSDGFVRSDHGGSRISLANIEQLFVEASDVGLSAQWLDGLAALRKLPGFSLKKIRERAHDHEQHQGTLISGMGDVDVNRYRTGLLEFLRERLGRESVVVGAGSLELVEEGIRYSVNGSARVALPARGSMVMWTPKISGWLTNLQSRLSWRLPRPRGYQVWEHWSLVSREAVDPTTIGIFRNATIWAETDGAPTRAPIHRLGILRFAGLYQSELEASGKWLGVESFAHIESLARELLGWDGLTIRAMKVHTLLDWRNSEMVSKKWGKAGLPIHLVPGSDGSAISIVQHVSEAVRRAFA